MATPTQDSGGRAFKEGEAIRVERGEAGLTFSAAIETVVGEVVE